MEAVVEEILEITGAGAAVELTDTLSKVAVASDPVFRLLTYKPTYTLCAMLIVSVAPTCVQVTPLNETYPLNVLPLRTSITQ